ncbi:MAG TPA: thioredoxin domain-containing protein, partial [Baekduia sp.]|nr:thioredoxin domain-containing protein [Baekduia sp.]
RSMTLETLRKMAIGGIHDQVGGGFSRYAVDRTWTVPHFEKMLYDNALLLSAYTHGYQLSGEPMLRDTATGIADWALRELRGPEGAFMSALDADSDGVEGLFYTWTEPELQAALGDLYETATRWLTPGSFEGRIVLEARGDFDALTVAERQTVRQRLLDARTTRVRPQTDTKRLTAWNGLMIGALARAGSAFERPDFTDAAQLAARFVLTSMRTPEGHLLRSSDGERAKLNGYLEDHAFLLEGLLGLYEATFDPDWFGAAREIADAMIVRFGDDQNGGFFSTSSDHEQLLTRRKDLEDNPIPSGNSSAALGLLRLAALTGDYSYEERAAGVFALVGDVAPRNAHAFGHLLTALDFHLLPTQEVALAGDDVAALAAVVRHHFRPHVVLAGPPGDGVPLMQGRTPVAGQAAAYVCERFACLQPMTDADALSAALH